jgi:hypothetical protein
MTQHADNVPGDPQTLSKPEPAALMLEERRNSAVWIRNLLLVPLGLVIFASVILVPWMLFSSRPTIEQLARSVVVLVTLGMVIGLAGFISGMLLLWFNVRAESAFKFKLLWSEFSADTRGAGVIGMALGTVLVASSLWVMTKIVFQQTGPLGPDGVPGPTPPIDARDFHDGPKPPRREPDAIR